MDEKRVTEEHRWLELRRWGGEVMCEEGCKIQHNKETGQGSLSQYIFKLIAFLFPFILFVCY